jgi:hypothetical protein
MALMQVYQPGRPVKLYKERRETHDRDFKRLYRFEHDNVKWLATHFQQKARESTETRGGALTPFQQMKVFLRYVSDPGFQSGVGEDIGIDQSTVSKVVNNVRKHDAIQNNNIAV